MSTRLMQGCRNAEALRKAKRTAAKNRAELGGIFEVRPKHTKKAAQGSRRWYRLQNDAFCRAFAESGETWPTEVERESAAVSDAAAADARPHIAREALPLTPDRSGLYWSEARRQRLEEIHAAG